MWLDSPPGVSAADNASEPSRECLALANRFVSLANDANGAYPASSVTTAIMYAAARLYAIHWLARTEDPDQSVEQAALDYRTQFDAMFKNSVQELALTFPGDRSD